MIICTLKNVMDERNVKIADIVKDTSVTRPTVTALYNNRSKGIQFDTLEKLCNYLNVNPNELITVSDLEVSYKNESEIKEIIGRTINAFSLVLDNGVNNHLLKFDLQVNATNSENKQNIKDSEIGDYNLIGYIEFILSLNKESSNESIRYYNSLRKPIKDHIYKSLHEYVANEITKVYDLNNVLASIKVEFD